MAMTKEQALALASARLRLKQRQAAPVDESQVMPTTELARESGFVKGYTDLPAGVAQLAEETGLTQDVMSSLSPEQVMAMKQQGIEIPFTSERIAKEEQIYQQGRAERGEDGFDWARMAGGMANPASLATFKVPIGGSLPAQAGKSAVMAGAYGTAMPVTEGDFTEKKLEQMALSAGLGGLFPPLLAAAKKIGGGTLEGGKSVLGTIFGSKGTMQREIKDLFVETVGKQRADAAEALMRADPDLTAAQALARASRMGDRDIGAGIARIEKSLARQPATGVPLRETYQAQEQARRGTLAGISGTPEEMAKDVAARKAATDPLYKAVDESKAAVDATPVLARVNQILERNPNRKKVTTPLNRVKQALQQKASQLDPFDEESLPYMLRQQADDVVVSGPQQQKTPAFLQQQAGLTDEIANIERNVQSLHSLSKDIDDMMAARDASGKREFSKKALQEVKSLLDSQIGKAEKAYTKAQEEYARLSVPINQKMIGRELERTAYPPKGTEEPAAFVKALDDPGKLTKKATGFRRPDLGVMSEQQQAGIKRVEQEMLDKLKQDRMAKSVENMLPRLSTKEEVQLPHILSRPVVITNAILKRVGLDRTDEYNAMATEILKNPQRLGELLKQPETSPQGKLARQILKDIYPLVIGQQSGRAVGQ